MSDSASQPPDIAALGALLPQIDIEGPLAVDTDPMVYKARQRTLDRDVAVCVWSAARSADPAFRNSIETGAKQLARLNHPNLIAVFDSGEADGWIYQITEYVHGKSLARSSDGKAIEPRTAVALVEALCAGIARAHQHGIVHGALRRDSVLLTPDATPKIGDFGTRDPGQVRPADDVRALGVILHELLTGQPHADGAPPPSRISGCNPKLDKIVSDALQADHGGFGDAAAMQTALREFQTGRSSRVLAVAKKHPTKAIGHAPVRPAPPARKTAAKAPPAGRLARNLVIIVILLGAIYFVWDQLHIARSSREQRNRATEAQNVEARKKAAEEAERKRRAKLRKPAPGGTAVPDAAAIDETPAGSLQRLRFSLADGERSEMPMGSMPKGDSSFFHVDQPMTWSEADRFANDFGAHLAIPGPEVDLVWLAGLVPDNERCWIGAGRSGRQDWSLCDGSRWTPETKPAGVGSYATLGPRGRTKALRDGERFGFLIQWRMDGSNPGTLEERLAAAAKAIAAKDLVFPPGTQRFGNRLFLPVMREVDWTTARKLAWSAGGHLAVLAESGEMFAADEIAGTGVPETSLWLGGYRDGDHWVWDTGEAWTKARWADDSAVAAENAALVMIPGTGWVPRGRNQTATGFLIEWSSDARSKTAGTADSGGPASEIAELTERARQLLARADGNRTKALEQNSKRYVSELNVWVRNHSSSQRAEWLAHVKSLTDAVRGHRVPVSVPKSSGVLLSPEMADLSAYAARKQEEADAAFATEARKIRDAYVPRLEKAAATAEQSGQRAVASSIRERIRLCGDLAAWTRSLGSELSPANPQPRSGSR